MSEVESTGTSNETLKKGENRKNLLEELFVPLLRYEKEAPRRGAI